LAAKGIWTAQDDISLKALNNRIEQLKIQLYQALFKEKQQVSLTKTIKQMEKAVEKGLMKKYSLDNMTLENFAETSRDEFLIAICLRNNNNKPVYDYNNYWGKQDGLIKHFINQKSKTFLTTSQFRELARSEPFRSLWSIGKEDLFGVPACDLTDDQKSLVLYSKMYDNVYEHPERPSDEVMDNDYMLDGWFALQRLELEKERKANEADKLLNKKGANRHGNNAGEMFIMADSQTEANKIRELNDLNATRKMKQRENAIKQKGSVSESNLPDVKLDLQNQAMRQFKDRGKK